MCTENSVQACSAWLVFTYYIMNLNDIPVCFYIHTLHTFIHPDRHIHLHIHVLSVQVFSVTIHTATLILYVILSRLSFCLLSPSARAIEVWCHIAHIRADSPAIPSLICLLIVAVVVLEAAAVGVGVLSSSSKISITGFRFMPSGLIGVGVSFPFSSSCSICFIVSLASSNGPTPLTAFSFSSPFGTGSSLSFESSLGSPLDPSLDLACACALVRRALAIRSRKESPLLAAQAALSKSLSRICAPMVADREVVGAREPSVRSHTSRSCRSSARRRGRWESQFAFQIMTHSRWRRSSMPLLPFVERPWSASSLRSCVSLSME